MRCLISIRAAAAALCIVAATGHGAQAQPCSSPYFVQQSFTSGSHTTEWMLCWQTPNSWGLVITSAFFRRAAGQPWIRVFWDARVSEIFVPYHDGLRFYDLTTYIDGPETLTAADCPAAVGGTLLNGVVCKEVHDRGLAWKTYTGTYRGRELVLWGSFPAANYRYIIKWTFRDDGVVLGELAATGANLPGHIKMSHGHSAMWRLDVDLNGFPNDRVERTVHTETGTTANDSEVLVATEQGLTWEPTQFTALHISDSHLTNSRGSTSGFMLIPVRSGSGRHDEDWTRRDFWVTRYDPAQMRPRFLPNYVNPPQPVVDTDIVVWYWGSLHHAYRDEDGIFNGDDFSGVAQTMWTGFMLKSHNLFDGPPFWSP